MTSAERKAAPKPRWFFPKQLRNITPQPPTHFLSFLFIFFPLLSKEESFLRNAFRIISNSSITDEKNHQTKKHC